MTALDAHYTPLELAAAIAEVGLECMAMPNAVIDIACGDGALLEAVTQQSESTQAFGIDRDRSIVVSLARRRPSWSISTGDALSPSSVLRSHVSKMWGEIDLAVLNPPFSCRGPRTIEVTLNGSKMRCSPHMAFVLAAMSALSPTGRLVTILPAGARMLVRDESAWGLIGQSCTPAIRLRYPRGSFPKVTASTELHVIDRKGEWIAPAKLPTPPALSCNCLGPIRGWLQMHSVTDDPDGCVLVHTSNLVDGKIQMASTRRVVTWRFLSGPAVLLPRVGKPNPSKVTVHRAGAVALSDCVFAVPCTSIRQAERLRKRIRESWQVIEVRYTGSCAPHLTLSNLRAALCRIEHGSAPIYNDL